MFGLLLLALAIVEPSCELRVFQRVGLAPITQVFFMKAEPHPDNRGAQLIIDGPWYRSRFYSDVVGEDGMKAWSERFEIRSPGHYTATLIVYRTHDRFERSSVEFCLAGGDTTC